jgi:hypothetical protein
MEIYLYIPYISSLSGIGKLSNVFLTPQNAGRKIGEPITLIDLWRQGLGD